MKKFIVTVLVSVAALIGMTACGPSSSTTPTGSAKPSAAAPASPSACLDAMKSALLSGGDTSKEPEICEGLDDATVTRLASEAFEWSLERDGWDVSMDR